MYSEHFDKSQTARIRDRAKTSLFNFTNVIYLQRVSLSSLDYNDFIAYHKTVNFDFFSFLVNCKQGKP